MNVQEIYEEMKRKGSLCLKCEHFNKEEFRCRAGVHLPQEFPEVKECTYYTPKQFKLWEFCPELRPRRS